MPSWRRRCGKASRAAGVRGHVQAGRLQRHLQLQRPVAVGLDGINITGEGQLIYSRTKDMQWWNGEGDPRWMLTARYNFQ
jgi:hypothetical protein